MNKLIFLGTGSAAHTTRQMTALCFMVNNSPLLIDCGDGFGTIRQLIHAGIDASYITDILLTHKHADHILGISHLLFYILINNPEVDIHIYGPRQTLELAKDISYSTHDYTREHSKKISWIDIALWKKTKINANYQVVASQVDGASKTSPTCYAYAVYASGKKVVFTADMKPNKSITKLSIDADILIHECFGLAKDEEKIHSIGHSTAKDAGLLGSNVHAKRLYLTHFPLEKGIESKLKKEAENYFKGAVIIAEDLMQVSL